MLKGYCQKCGATTWEYRVQAYKGKTLVDESFYESESDYDVGVAVYNERMRRGEISSVHVAHQKIASWSSSYERFSEHSKLSSKWREASEENE